MKPKFCFKNRLAVALTSLTFAMAVSGCGQHDSAVQPPAPTKTVSSEAMFAFDIEDQKKVAGAAEYIFVGTVTEKLLSTSRMEPFPETQFMVHVNSVLKGDISGDVTVSQQGGLDEATNILYLMEDDPLLEVGSAYVLTTNLDPTSGWYTVTVLAGHEPVPVESAEMMENAPMSRGAVAEEPAAVVEMRDSIENQVDPLTGW